ncbi:hypothetical protein NC653_011681 [Populus alba x Populus x berolinensis]|uniref:Uncharacterized protein n=1 Tax=Populus alba x Populus x berolinensis TaxID=444605 RepID=A0AAD6W6P7_9ROSI|nr:hypothetical protein NC653_011681 [Populus alba x Populus x berolinensis]
MSIANAYTYLYLYSCQKLSRLQDRRRMKKRELLQQVSDLSQKLTFLLVLLTCLELPIGVIG